MTDKLKKVQQVLDSGDRAKAAKMLQYLLKHEPSADAWVLAAKMSSDETQQINLLRKALAMDEWHTEANRLLHKLEGPKTLDDVKRKHSEWDKQTGLKPLEDLKRERRKTGYEKYNNRQGVYTRIGCWFMILLMFSSSLFVMRVVGLLPSGVMGTFNGLTGGATPVSEIEGTPIHLREDAPLILTPAQVKEAVATGGMEVMDAGYLHEHTFRGSAGEEVAIYVQFLSANANAVSRNVIVIDPAGNDATGLCFKDQILQGDNNVALTCRLNGSGTWAVRVLGRAGESVGTYFVGVESLTNF